MKYGKPTKEQLNKAHAKPPPPAQAPPMLPPSQAGSSGSLRPRSKSQESRAKELGVASLATAKSRGPCESGDPPGVPPGAHRPSSQSQERQPADYVDAFTAREIDKGLALLLAGVEAAREHRLEVTP